MATSKLERKLSEGLTQMLAKKPLMEAAYFARSIIEGFESYLRKSEIADFAGVMSRYGFLAFDGLPTIPCNTLENLADRGIRLGEHLMTMAIKEHLKQDPKGASREVIRSSLEDIYEMYVRFSLAVYKVVETKLHSFIKGNLNAPHEDVFILLDGAYGYNPAAYLSIN